MDAIIVIVYYFCRDTQHHNTHIQATSNEGRTPRALDDAQSQLGDHPGLVLFRTHTHITTYFAHTHIMAQRGYEIETLVVPDSYIPLHTVTRFMQSLLNHERKDKKRDVGWTIPLFLYNSDAAKEEGRERWGSKGRKCFIILFVCVYTNASQPRFVSKETLTNEAQRIECDLKCLSFQLMNCYVCV